MGDEETARNLFWGITLDGNKRYSQTVQQSFHVSMAALDFRDKGHGDSSGGFVGVMVEHCGAEFLVCTLQHGKLYQQRLDLIFTKGEAITLYLHGKGTVHLTGYLVDDEDGENNCCDDDHSGDLSSDAESELSEEDASEDTEDSEVDGESSGSDSKKKEKMKRKIVEKDDDDDDEAPELVSSDDDKKPVPPAKRPKSDESRKVKTEQPLAEKDQKHRKPEGALVDQKHGKPKDAVTTESVDDGKKKKKKKNKKKNKDADSGLTSPPAAATTPSSSGSQRKTLAGGVVVEDLKTGSGPEAKPGKMVHAFYIGRLSSSGKMFDQTISGKPFSFRLGKGEVIKGWDVGIQGMKVGGKRKIIVPSRMGYGDVKTGNIPAGSELTFEVELKAVN